jgi:PiT family inorganic phosphate transporter
VAKRSTDRGFRLGQIGSASLVSLAHGTNDAQKTMGVITLALIAHGSWTDTASIPFWVKLACALSISLGTYLGGWRIIRTMGKGLVDIESRQGMAAESASAAVILASSQLGFALSTTQVTTGSVLGTGLGRPGAKVRWRVAGRMLVAWVITMPSAGLVAAAAWWLADAIGGAAGALTITFILMAISAVMYATSRHEPINANNVNDEWTGPPRTGRRRETVGA